MMSPSHRILGLSGRFERPLRRTYSLLLVIPLFGLPLYSLINMWLKSHDLFLFLLHLGIRALGLASLLSLTGLFFAVLLTLAMKSFRRA
jgi:hypothetical protein